MDVRELREWERALWGGSVLWGSVFVGALAAVAVFRSDPLSILWVAATAMGFAVAHGSVRFARLGVTRAVLRAYAESAP